MKDIVEFSSTVVTETVTVIGHTDKDWKILGAAADKTTPWSADLAKIYGSTIQGCPHTQAVMEGVNAADHQASFAVWYENLVSGAPGEVFWAETCLIGLYHAAAGVNNRHVIAMASRIEEEFLKRSLEAMDQAQALELYGAFKRVLGTALGVMVDSYLHAIMLGMSEIGMNERLVARIRKVAIRRMINQAREVLPLIDWTDALSVGIPSIDEQHKKLMGYLNALHDSSVTGKGNEQIKQILQDLVAYTVDHFAYEEKLFDEHDYEHTAAHKEAHVALTTQVGKFNEEFQAGNAKLSGDLFKFLRTWLNGHIRGTDKLYSAPLIERGVK